METYTISSLDELTTLAENMLAKLALLPSHKAVLLTLQGDLGAGKTALVQKIGEILGVSEPIVSPTFVVMKQYTTSNERFSYLVHMDAYRLADEAETRPLHLDSFLLQSNTLVCIEWAELIAGVLPAERNEIKIKDVSGDRVITVQYYGY